MQTLGLGNVDINLQYVNLYPIRKTKIQKQMANHNFRISPHLSFIYSLKITLKYFNPL